MSDATQIPSETKLTVLRKLAEGQMSFTVTNAELLALVECAEALQYAIDYESGDVGCLRHWKYVASERLDKLEAV
jgi:hypothetical protein